MITPVFINRTRQPVPKKFLTAWLKLVVAELKKTKSLAKKLKNKELVIVFLGEKSARNINKQFRGRDYATDVLSFGSEDETSMGELVLCPKVVDRQAKEHGLSYRAELAYLVLHGVLHLLGFEHEQGGKPAQRMYSLQDRIFTQIDKLI